jgi:hypothetical protein
MDVSGRKQRKIHESVESGSAEDSDFKCEPCRTIDQCVDAYGYCVNCKDFLCETCCSCHKTSKASLNHHILGRSQFNNIPATKPQFNECKESCHLHQEEVIKFFCPMHNALGCNDCMTLDHRTCEIEYIPEKCNDILRELGEKLKEAEEVYEKASSLSNIMSEHSDKVVRRIELFRKEIDERFDLMQEEIIKRAEEMKSKNLATVKEVSDTCEHIISDVHKWQSSLNANKSGNHAQLFIDIQRAEAALQSYQMDIAKDQITKANMRYSFRDNTDLKTLLAKENIFGELVRHIDYMTRKEDFNIKT